MRREQHAAESKAAAKLFWQSEGFTACAEDRALAPKGKATKFLVKRFTSHSLFGNSRSNMNCKEP